MSSVEQKIEKLEKKVDEDRLKSSLDSLFLVLLSFVTFIMGFVYSAVGWLFLVFVPMFFGLFITPFWYGQIRGSLLEDSLKIRLVGWHLLILGTVSTIFPFIIYFYLGFVEFLDISSPFYITIILNIIIPAILGYLSSRYLLQYTIKLVMVFVKKLRKKHAMLDFGKTESLRKASGEISFSYTRIFMGVVLLLLFSERLKEATPTTTLLEIILTIFALLFSTSFILSSYYSLTKDVQEYLKTLE